MFQSIEEKEMEKLHFKNMLKEMFEDGEIKIELETWCVSEGYILNSYMRTRIKIDGCDVYVSDDRLYHNQVR